MALQFVTQVVAGVCSRHMHNGDGTVVAMQHQAGDMWSRRDVMTPSASQGKNPHAYCSKEAWNACWVVSTPSPCMQVIWNNYIHAMRQAGFSSGTGVYVASGLLTYGASQGTSLRILPCMVSAVHDPACSSPYSFSEKQSIAGGEGGPTFQPHV